MTNKPAECGIFETMFQAFWLMVYPHLTDPDAINEIRRVYFAGAIDLIVVFENTSNDDSIATVQALTVRNEIVKFHKDEVEKMKGKKSNGS